MSRVIMAGLKTSQTGASNCENLVNASIVWSLHHIMCIIWHKPYSYIICAIWAHYFGNDSHVRGCWISWWSPHLKTLHWSVIKRVLDWHHSSKNVWRWLKRLAFRNVLDREFFGRLYSKILESKFWFDNVSGYWDEINSWDNLDPTK